MQYNVSEHDIICNLNKHENNYYLLVLISKGTIRKDI
jgi:hypothetical protein